MVTYKTIFSGYLDFGSERSFEQVLKMYNHRYENYYRKSILLEQEDVFDEENLCLDIPRFITQATNKEWNNTINLLSYVAQYAIAGNFRAWKLENGKCLDSTFIEPEGDKAAIQQFLQGRNLIKEDGKEDEANKALSRAIEKFERHAFAYERRGFVNYRLGNYKDAIYDYTKSIDICQNNAEPYLGRAYSHRKLGDIQAAIADLGMACKKSIPHQAIYWQARRLKGELHLSLKEYEKAMFEFKMFTNRAFDKGNPNFARRKQVFALYGKALIGAGQYKEAIDMFNNSLAIEEKGQEKAPAASEPLLYRGIARQKAGQKGFVKDWKEASELGSVEAKELLASR